MWQQFVKLPGEFDYRLFDIFSVEDKGAIELPNRKKILSDIGFNIGSHSHSFNKQYDIGIVEISLLYGIPTMEQLPDKMIETYSAIKATQSDFQEKNPAICKDLMNIVVRLTRNSVY